MLDRRLLAAALLLAAAVGSTSPTLAQALPAAGEAVGVEEAVGAEETLGAGDAGPAEGKAAALEFYDPLFDEAEVEDPFQRDPFERANRWTFAFNEGLDRWLLDPLTRSYQWLVPPPVRHSVNRVFDNLNSPVIFANEVLQLRPARAATTLTRFTVNSTLGLAGIFDVADEVMHLPGGEADFGQTLARYWVPRGPYLVVPVFGPSTARDAVGTVVDQVLDPLTYLVGPLNLRWQLILGSGQGLALRDANLDDLDALRDSSVDYYSALRSAYLQVRRAKELEARGEAPPGEAPNAFEPAPADQDSPPDASFSIRASMAAISPEKSSRLTMPENSERRSASSLTVPSR